MQDLKNLKIGRTTWRAPRLSQNQKILKDGQPLATFDENFNELLTQAKEFQKTDYPVLQSLGIV